GGVLRREAVDLIQRVGVEGLGPPEDRGQGLVGRPDQVDLRLLGGEGAAGCLGVETEPPGAGVLGPITRPHGPGPDSAGRPELGDVLEEVQVAVEEEGEPGANWSMASPRWRQAST